MRLVRWNKGKWHEEMSRLPHTFCGRDVPRDGAERITISIQDAKKEQVSLCGLCFDLRG